MLLQHKLKRMGLRHKVAEVVSLTYMYPYIARDRSSYGMHSGCDYEGLLLTARSY